jgi:hypothetical protein
VASALRSREATMKRWGQAIPKIIYVHTYISIITLFILAYIYIHIRMYIYIHTRIYIYSYTCIYSCVLMISSSKFLLFNQMVKSNLEERHVHCNFKSFEWTKMIEGWNLFISKTTTPKSAVWWFVCQWIALRWNKQLQHTLR